MVPRTFWCGALESAWSERPLVWLSGVRRSGKTTLCESLANVEVFDCERPRTRALLEDADGFLESVRGKRLVLDEIHRLPNPSELLKVAHDHHPTVRIIATGSSSLEASRKFADTLTGRKRDVWLTPMNAADLTDFGSTDIQRRLLHGGLPSMFLSARPPDRDFQEWVDSYWSKDVSRLFSVSRRASFERFLELVLAQSGGLFEGVRMARDSGVSRPTVATYLAILEQTYVVHVVRPFSNRKATEIVAAPKVYAFDTGFVAWARGWSELRSDDVGQLWEHYVLNEIQSRGFRKSVRHWRDKRGHEVDFVLVRRGRPLVAIECKWSARAFEAAGLSAFRRRYPKTEAWLVAGDAGQEHGREIGSESIRVMGLGTFAKKLDRMASD
jgi:predicted AAA+ superfamily ATPase